MENARELAKGNPAMERLVYDLRDPTVDNIRFRERLETLGEYIGVEIAKELDTKDMKMLTPLKGTAIHEIPMEEECLKLIPDARKGKNMWVLGMLCYIYHRDLEKAENQISLIFKKKSQAVVDINIKLLRAGYQWAASSMAMHYEIPPMKVDYDQVVMNGNEELSLGIMAAGIEVCSMYPITPATSGSHHLAEYIPVNNLLHFLFLKLFL